MVYKNHTLTSLPIVLKTTFTVTVNGNFYKPTDGKVEIFFKNCYFEILSYN